MKTRKTLVCGILAVVLTLVFAACPEPEESGGELAFELINNGTAYRVRKGTVRDGAVVIPATYKGLPVTEIEGFSSPYITSVTIPDSVTSINSGTFYGCTSLTSVTIGANVTVIGEMAFKRCTSLTSITLPASVTTIGKEAFYECTSLTSITIPDSVTSIDSGTFYSCTGLTSITLGVSVTTIGGDAQTYGIADAARRVFSGCTSLTVITVNSGNPNFASEGGVLYNKDKTQILTVPLGITTVTIPASVAIVGSMYGSMFNDCTRLTAITVDSGNSNFASDGGVLYNKNKTELIRAPEGITAVTIPNGVTTIKGQAFSMCESLTSIIIPDSVTTIDVWAFTYCTSLTSITIPSNVIIDPEAFRDCTSLRSVTIGTNVDLKKFANDATSTVFPGDLDSVYTTTNSKAAGTYTSANGSSWTKQS